MRHFRIQEDHHQSQTQSKVSFRQAFAKSLHNTLKLLPFAQFTVNYGYAIQNVWITMVMIIHKTPAWLDSFVWITPIILAVLVRPYLVRFIHQINWKVYREINVTCFALLLGAVGCFVVGLSCDVQKREKSAIFSHTFVRILLCSIGWTLMDVGFEFVLYFANKIKESYEGLLEKQSQNQKEEKKQENQSLFTEENFAFYGLFVGYVVSILICWIIHGKSIKAFYRCAKYAYFSVGILAGVTGLRLYIQGKLNLLRRSDEPQAQSLSNSPILVFQKRIDFYLPGYTELLQSNAYTFSLLVVHSVIVFLNDIILIYTTMWFSDLKGTKYESQGEAYIYGLQVGALTLLAYTIIDNIKIKGIIFSNPYILQGMFIIVGVAFAFANLQYGHIGFILLAISLSILNHFYRRAILARQSQENPLFQRCIETTERIQKIIVLSIFPGVVLLILNRDDIPDSLLVSAGLCLLALCAFLVSRLNVKPHTNEIRSVKVEKIE